MAVNLEMPVLVYDLFSDSVNCNSPKVPEALQMATVLSLVPQDNPQKVSIKNESEIILAENRISCFYQCKQKMDENEVTQMILFCSQKYLGFWQLVCSQLLSPLYTWKVEACTKDEGMSLEGINIEDEIQKYLSTLESVGNIKVLKSALIPPKFHHGFTCRTGGISLIPGLKSLNLTFSNHKRDPQAVIMENRRRLAQDQGFSLQNFHMASAVHGRDIHIIGEEQPQTGYDGILTNQKDVTVAAPGADCITMVFVDPMKNCFGALHSGWMGTTKQAAVAMVNKMVEVYDCNPADILVVLGPSIGKCCFEFGADNVEQFQSICPESVFWKEGKPKPFVDLHLINRQILERRGVLSTNIDDESCTMCTKCHPEFFFSYRRDGKPFGNQVSFVGLT